MILSDTTLKNMIKEGSLVCEPIDEKSIQPASIDCRLGNHFLVVEENHMHVITLGEEIQYREIINESIVIPPHSFLLATTQEYVELPDDLQPLLKVAVQLEELVFSFKMLDGLIQDLKEESLLSFIMLVHCQLN